MQQTVTRVDDVVDALIAKLGTLFPAGTEILDGPRAAQTLGDLVIQVGVGNSDRAEAYLSETVVQPGLGERLAETITLYCEMSTWSGDQDHGLQPMRSALAANLGLIDNAFRSDPMLGGAVDRVWLGARTRWYALQSPDGAGCGLEFSVTAKAWL